MERAVNVPTRYDDARELLENTICVGDGPHEGCNLTDEISNAQNLNGEELQYRLKAIAFERIYGNHSGPCTNCPLREWEKFSRY